MTVKIGDTVTISTEYGMLPGTHRGTVIERIGPWWTMEVFVPCRHRHERVSFSEDRIVGDDAQTTDLSVAAMENYRSRATRAGIEP
jgi:hypothetical protein